MGLVDDRVGERDLQSLVALPIKRVVDHDRLGNRDRIIFVVGFEVVVLGAIGHVGQDIRVLLPVDDPLDGFRIRVDQQLCRVEAVPLRWVVGAPDPVAVALTRSDAGEVAMPIPRAWAVTSTRVSLSPSS